MTPIAWAVAAVLALAVLMLAVQVQGLRKRLDALPEGDDDVVAMLMRIDQEVGTLFSNATETGARVADLEAAAPATLRASGTVRYDGFPGMVGLLSRSVAVLDATASGYVLSVLVNREESRFYLKEVENGAGREPLSPEELEAVAEASGRRNPA